MSDIRRPLDLIDASVFVFRAHFAVAGEFVDRDGYPVHAVHGFLNFLLSYLKDLRPTHLLVAFDGSLDSSFRNRLYPAYKANREAPDESILRQFRYCESLAKSLGLCHRIDTEFEADDLIASAIHQLRPHGFSARIATADKDLSQLLLDDHDALVDPPRKSVVRLKDVKQKFGVSASMIVDYLALAGDAVDNIPGVKGVGEKTAAGLLNHFGSMDAMYERLEEIQFLRSIRGAGTLAIKLKEQKAMAILSRELTRLSVAAPVPSNIEAYQPQKPDASGLDELLDELQFGPLTRRRIREYADGFN